MSSPSPTSPDGPAVDEKVPYARPDSGDSDADKHEASTLTPPRQSLFARLRSKKPKQPAADDEKLDLPADLIKDNKKVVPVGFGTLFRFSTKTELFLDAIGLVCAAASGAAQPLMSLLFGNTSQDFVTFGSAVQFLDPNDPASVSAMDDAKHHFLHDTSLNALYLVFIGIGVLVATYIYMLTWTYTGELNAKRIRERYLKAVLRQDIAYFDTIGAGEIATRIQTDTHLIQQGISEKVALCVFSISAFITGFILAYARSWRLALAMSSILPCIVITGGVMNKFVGKYTNLSLGYIAEGGSVAEEVISTIRTAQAFGTQSILANLYDGHVAKAHEVELKAAAWHGCGLATFFFIIYSAYALAFDFGTTLIIHGEANAGIIVTVFMSILIGSFSLALLAPEMQAVSQGRAAAAKIFATIDRVPSIDSESEAGLRPDSVHGEISLENINFSYPSRPDVPVVKNMSIKFEAGKTAALVGASGSGKSTVIQLVERFYDPLSGSVKLDGVDLKDLNVRWLRCQIGLVSQEPVLFATTIKGNVAQGLIGTVHENASDEEKFALIKEACIKANADGFITKLPLGYDTLVGERGFLLSGGQKQRVAIARAIVSDPRILLLDEATSALDTRSEGVVQDALDKAAAGRTTITIAHRLSTIRDADQIYVIGGGVVLEHGTHNELLSDPNSPYSKLVEAQKLREAKENAATTVETNSETEEGSGDGEGEGDIDEQDIKQELKREQSRQSVESLKRQNTGRSLASEVLERKRANGELDRFDGREYGLLYLFKRMGRLQGEVWKNYAVGTIFAAAAGMVYPAFGIVYSMSITAFQNTDPHILRHDGDLNALWFFIISIASAFVIGIENFIFSSAAAHLTKNVRSLLFRAILRQDIEFFDQDSNSTGALTSNLSDSPQKISGLAGITLGAIVQAIATIIGGSIIGLAYTWKLALVAIACMPVLVSAGFIRLRVVVLKDQKNKKAHEGSAQVACEAAGAVRTVASLTRERDCLDIYSKSLEEPLRISNRTAVYSTLIYAASQSMSFFVIGLVFWYGAQLVGDGEYSTGDFFIGLFSTTFGAIQAGNVFSFVPDISSAKGAMTDIVNMLDARPAIDAESTTGEVPKHSEGRIQFRDVHFRYPTRPGMRVLQGLNLTVKPGTYIALVGASGCGKSTTIQLIERFYDPLHGKVLLDGHDIAELNIQEYRKNIALVSQEPTLYAGSIRFNILLGATKPEAEVTQEEIVQACRNANILEFIESLPQGFDTEVGGKGSQLSGGQKQRIAIARALLRNPKVLLLDEATSALDSTSEKVVQEALDKASRGRTTIAIAHRLSTIQNADCIYFIKEGKVSEFGTHDQLLALRGDYFEYVQLQALSKT